MNESASLLVPLKDFTAYFFKCRSKFEEALELFLWSLLIFIIINVILFYLVHNFRNGKSKFRFCRSTKLPENVSRVLLVTAHPDDECMFFAPSLICRCFLITIISLLLILNCLITALGKKRDCRIFVLCLSRGE